MHNKSESLLNEAYKHLKNDPVIYSVIRTTGKLSSFRNKNVYSSLISSVISQQLSTRVADVILKRFYSLFDNKIPDPGHLINTDLEVLRSAGLSMQKASYIKNIAMFAQDDQLKITLINKMSDQELIDHLTRIKGVGRWTAEMILIFSMNRPDVFPADDLVIRQTTAKLYKLKGDSRKLTEKLYKISDKWSPYKSIASRHLWMYRDSAE